jgi:FkbM family methyltransferase
MIKVTGPRGQVIPLKVWTYVDMLVVREIFLDRDYRMPPGLSPATILDLGANVGISTRYFRGLFPDATVIAVEPDPAQFVRLLQNTSDDPDVRPMQVASTVSNGPVEFYAASEGWYSSLDRPPIPAVQTTVQGATIVAILSRVELSRVDLVKMDIEGGEWALLESGAIQSVCDCIVGELHHRAPGQTIARAEELLDGWSLTVHEARGQVSSFTARRRAMH